MKTSIFKKHGIIFLIISGVLTALPLVFEQIGFIQWISLIPMALVLWEISKQREISLGKIYLFGLVFFESYFVVVFHWFSAMYPLEFIGVSKPVAAFIVLLACFGVSFVEAALYSLVFVAFAVIKRLKLLQGSSSVFIMPFVAASLWVIFEWIQTLSWWGVPWGRLCLGQINAPVLLGSASLFGSYFITFVIVAVNFLFAYAVFAEQNRKRAIVCAVCAIGLFGLNLTLGVASNVTHKDGERTIRIAAVQGNNPNGEKWLPQTFGKMMETHTRLTREAAQEGADIVLWSETAFPYEFFDTYELITPVTELAKETGVTILISAFTESEDPEKLYVSLIEVRPDGTYGDVEYHKQRLVPFGEFVPMRELLTVIIPPLAEISMLDNDIAVGNESSVMHTQHAKIGVGICYDSIFEEILRRSVNNGAEVLVVTTNDSWFGTSAALAMHNSQSQLRAIENGRYVVRCANTGISSIISPKGEIIESLPAAVEGYIINDVHLNTHNTLYSLIGNAFVYICMAFCSILPIFNAIIYLLSVKSVKNR